MISCHQSAAALPLIHAAQPDLVLLDIKMEQWDAGLQFLAALRRNQVTRRLPVIICSANLPLLRQQEQTIRELAAITLAKPYTFDTLLATITTALGQPPPPVAE